MKHIIADAWPRCRQGEGVSVNCLKPSLAGSGQSLGQAAGHRRWRWVILPIWALAKRDLENGRRVLKQAACGVPCFDGEGSLLVRISRQSGPV